MSHHKVRLHRWENGILKAFNHFFEKFEDAKTFADSSDAHGVKIYDQNNEVVHSVTNAPEQGAPQSTYA